MNEANRSLVYTAIYMQFSSEPAELAYGQEQIGKQYWRLSSISNMCNIYYFCVQFWNIVTLLLKS